MRSLLPRLSLISRFITTGALLAALVGCSTSAPPAQEYLLMSQAAPALKTDYHAKVVVPTVEIPLYLAGNGIVLVSEQGQVSRARQNLWAEPLDSQLQRLALNRLEQRLPGAHWLTPFDLNSAQANQLLINVARFDASPDGKITIHGQWLLQSSTGNIVQCGRFAHSDTLAAQGYQAMANALANNWLHEVIDPIAQSLIKPDSEPTDCR
ncbi:ABC-type transport auxiliary lipoprotein family protein [Vibrio tritonius]|uniref:ABC-type transport auxiliary lipoprotein family protein n=1 Tax=Vibrio tritonius TaxID=1435069 RepID=A0ABS7YTH1_9VIBR|nr:ABC-type transport auxiliary lipoprotein family protein [Vibrio tritonius]MCA2018991.1 ABC-type transport auxiliary lipoprotein family protein [Vibrio tritonius]